MAGQVSAAVTMSILHEDCDNPREQFSALVSLVVLGFGHDTLLTYLIWQLIETKSETPFFGGFICSDEIVPFVTYLYV